MLPDEMLTASNRQEIISKLVTDTSPDLVARLFELYQQLDAQDERFSIIKEALLKIFENSPTLLEPYLLHTDATIRGIALGISTVLENPQIIDTLLKAIRSLSALDGSADLETSAISVAGILGFKLRGKVLPDNLIELFYNPEPQVRYLAVYTIQDTSDERALDLLTEKLEDVDSLVRLTAIQRLGELGDQSVLQKLFTISQTDEDRDIQDCARDSFSKIRERVKAKISY